VDIEIRRSMWDFLRGINAQGTTIILTTHYLEEAENLCRHIAIIDGGEIVENTRMQTLLGRLHLETFVLDLRHPLAGLPDLPGYPLRRLDDLTLEADVSKELGINALFQQLSARGIEVSSLRNKSNRLEELCAINPIDWKSFFCGWSIKTRRSPERPSLENPGSRSSISCLFAPNSSLCKPS